MSIQYTIAKKRYSKEIDKYMKMLTVSDLEDIKKTIEEEIAKRKSKK